MPPTPLTPPAERRRALPPSADGLPSLGPGYAQALESALSELGVRLTPGARGAIDAQARLLLAWNTSINLTALRSPEQIAREHVADSLAALPLLRGPDGDPTAAPAPRPSLLDIGSGPGYPGLPLAVTLPAGRAALVDSVAKKAAFLDVAAESAAETMRTLGEEPPGISVFARRAEALAGEPAHRERWDIVVSRAVGSLAELAELGLPLLRVGGRLLAWKRDDGSGALGRELTAAATIVRRAGGRPDTLEVHGVGVVGLEDHRIVVVAKHRATPSRYPRPPAERKRALIR